MGCVYSLNAVGLSLIFGVVGLINFAYSDFMMIAMYLCYWLYLMFCLDPLFSIPLAILFCAFLGWLTYFLIIKWILKATGLVQALSTFALGIILRNLVVLVFGQDYHLINDSIVSGQIFWGDLTINTAMMFAAFISIVASAALWTFLTRTKTGLGLRATAINRQAASLMGINSPRMFVLAFVIGSSCVGVAGAALSSFYYIYPYIGAVFSIITFTTIALGGFGSIPGAFIAGLIIGLVESFSGFYFDPSLKYAVIFLLYICVIVVKPKGLKGW